jgi:putative nucleotidyltransferase with HDIG domain
MSPYFACVDDAALRSARSGGLNVVGLRPAMRAYVVVVLSATVILLAATAGLPAFGDLARAFLFAAVASVAQLRPVYLSEKLKVSAEDVATFAAALVMPPFLAGLVAGSSSLVALRTSPGESWGPRLFNASVATAGTISAALVFGWLAPGGSIVSSPVAVIAAALTKYGLETGIVDVAVGIQLRRSPLPTWWRIHRRDLAPHAVLYLIGVVAALMASLTPWAILIFVLPAVVLSVVFQERARLGERSQRAVLELADRVDARDPYTRGHSQRTAALAERLARRMGLDPSQVELIRLAARVHDIGKIATDDAVLLKRGPLDPDESIEMRRHSELGASLLGQIPEFWEGASIVLAHHERPDGGGYPRGLRGGELSIESAVVAVADAYDAMSSDRPYRRGMPWPEVRAELIQHRGTQWDAHVVDAFVILIDEEHVPGVGPESSARAG